MTSLVWATWSPQSAAIWGMIACQMQTSTNTVIDIIMYTSWQQPNNQPADWVIANTHCSTGRRSIDCVVSGGVNWTDRHYSSDTVTGGDGVTWIITNHSRYCFRQRPTDPRQTESNYRERRTYDSPSRSHINNTRQSQTTDFAQKWTMCCMPWYARLSQTDRNRTT